MALVDELNSETEKLNIEVANMSRKIQEEKDNGKIIEYYVLEWQNDVEREIRKSEIELSPSCSCIEFLPIPDPVSRFQIGRNAANKAKTVVKLTDTGKDYLTKEIAHLPPFENRPKSNNAYEEFQSRSDVYQKLYDGLVNKDSPLVHGIYGMAGAGKTKMMEKFWEDAMNEKIFDKVVPVNVGNENFNEIKLQDQIAGCLNCHFNSQDVERRASQLEQSLRNGGKILLILDDVWTEIPLDNIIGTPFTDNSNSTGSKILLTSRQKDVLVLNKCEHLVEIKTLSPDEALYLFENAVGTHTVNSLKDDSLVLEVCFECGHLPLLINAVGKALKGKRHNSWKDARDQLKKGHFEKIPGVPPRVYEGIKLSIDYLEYDDAKSCLFLCSLFPEDANIDMKMLIHLAIGSQLIPDGESRILAMVDSLKASSLLLDSGRYNETKVHDIIRDVARSMASTDSEYAFLHVKCNSRYFPSDAGSCTGKFLRLDVETHDVHFKEDPVWPDLHTLWLQCNNHPQQFSGGFFRMFVNLGFLMLQNVNISLEHFSLQPLGNLRTLDLFGCDIKKTDFRLFPENIITLCIWHCDLPRPLDVSNLKYLQKLEIQQDGELVMMQNFVSSLSSLVELHIPNGFIIDHEEYQMEPIVMEISKLTFEDTNNLSNIERYNICVDFPEVSYYSNKHSRIPSTKRIELFGNHWKSWEDLIARAEEVRLEKSDVELSSICNDNRRAFEDLKTLFVDGCNNMESLASASQDEIQYSLQPANCFFNLGSLTIRSCSKLKYLFCTSIAKSLVQLQELSVYDCESMEAIIMNDGTSDGEIVNFLNLKSLKILYIPRLASFYWEEKNMHSGSTSLVDPSVQYQPLFDRMVMLPSLNLLDVRSANASVIWGMDCYADKLNSLVAHDCDKLEILIPQAMLHRLNYLECIHVFGCSRLRTMFLPSIATDLKHLKELRVYRCGEISEIIEAGEQVITDDGILFPELTDLELNNLPSLTSFWCYRSGKHNTCKVPLRLLQLSSIVLNDLPALKSFFHGSNFELHMPALKKVEVINCGLSTLFTVSMFRNFQPVNLEVRNCKLLENIVEDLRGDETSNEIIPLSQLTTVYLKNLPNLKSFFHSANYEFYMPVLKKVRVFDCGLSDTLFTRSVFKNLKQLEDLKVGKCKLLESIFEDARADEDTRDEIITLNQVSAVDLGGLPKLKSIFYGATYWCYMPALKKVTIAGCGISVLFTCSVFREIQQLEELHVSDCKSLEHIVEEVGGHETSDELKGKSIESPKLSKIVLTSLPNLKSFSCSPSYVFNMPNLHILHVRNCPQIEYFSSSKTNTRAVRVYIEWRYEEGIQDLNDYIKQNHKRGSFSSDCAGESSYRSQDLGTQSGIIEEEKPQETETDQPDHSSVE
ncbi:hypothetical protein AgCh_014733 [Apium graveolens]